MSSPAPLPGVFGSIAPVLDDHGYLAIAGVVFLESIGLPIPGEAAVVVGAVFAATGRMDLTAVAAVACVAAALGDVIGYAVGRRAGRPLVLRAGRPLGVTADRLARAEEFYARRGAGVIVVARFLPLLRRFNALVAGISRMPWRAFLAFNLLGAAVWAAAWTVVGDQASNHLDTLNAALTTNLPYAIAVVCCVVVAVALLHAVRRRVPPHPGAVVPIDFVEPLPEAATWQT